MVRVLVLDMDCASRDLLVEALSLEDCTVGVVGRAEEALDRVKQGGVDVLVAEVHMPDGLGWNLFPRVHAADPRVLVVAMTSDDSWETSRKTRAMGEPLFFYAIKPLDMKEIRRVVCCAGDWRRKHLFQGAK